MGNPELKKFCERLERNDPTLSHWRRWDVERLFTTPNDHDDDDDDDDSNTTKDAIGISDQVCMLLSALSKNKTLENFTIDSLDVSFWCRYDENCVAKLQHFLQCNHKLRKLDVKTTSAQSILPSQQPLFLVLLFQDLICPNLKSLILSHRGGGRGGGRGECASMSTNTHTNTSTNTPATTNTNTNTPPPTTTTNSTTGKTNTNKDNEDSDHSTRTPIPNSRLSISSSTSSSSRRILSEIANFIQRSTSLEILSIAGCHYDSSDLQALIYAIQHNTSLKKLDLFSFKCSSSSNCTNNSNSTNNPMDKHDDMDCPQDDRIKTIRSLFQVLSNHTTISTIRLYKCKIHQLDDLLGQWFEQLADNTTTTTTTNSIITTNSIQTLDIHFDKHLTPIKQWPMTHLAHYLTSSNCHLTTLSLVGVKLSKHNVLELETALQQQQQLTSSSSSPKYSTNSTRSTLESLTLEENDLTPELGSRIAMALQNNNTVKVLRLPQNDILSHTLCMESWKQLLRSNTTLQELFLSNCHAAICYVGLSKLFQGLLHNASLQRLSIDETWVRNGGTTPGTTMNTTTTNYSTTCSTATTTATGPACSSCIRTAASRRLLCQDIANVLANSNRYSTTSTTSTASTDSTFTSTRNCLKELKLHNFVSFQDSFWIPVAQAMQFNTTLEKLTLHDVGLGNGTMQTLAKSLSSTISSSVASSSSSSVVSTGSNTQLVVQKDDCNSSTAATPTSTSTALLSSYSKLKSLDASQNPYITAQGMWYFYNALPWLPMLETLFFHQYHISKEKRLEFVTFTKAMVQQVEMTSTTTSNCTTNATVITTTNTTTNNCNPPSPPPLQQLPLPPSVLLQLGNISYHDTIDRNERFALDLNRKVKDNLLQEEEQTLLPLWSLVLARMTTHLEEIPLLHYCLQERIDLLVMR